MQAAEPAGARQIAPFAVLSASYFAHIGFFNPYLPLWLQHLGFPIFVISLLAAVQSGTRIFAPYVWGMLSDRTGERVRLLRWSAFVALASSLGLWWADSPLWVGVVLLVLFTHTSSMMALTEAAMAHLVAGDWGRYGRIRLWGSIGFMATVFIAGAWFEHFGMGHFPGWTLLTLAAVLGGTLWLPDSREKRTDAHDAGSPVGPVLRQAPVRWFFATLFFHVTAHFSIYAYFSLYLDSKGYGKATIGALWAVSVVVEIAWFFLQGRLMRLARMSRWLMVCSLATVLRMALVGVAADWILALVLAQMLHALTFAAHHTACIAVVTHHFPGRLRARGQALFTVIGYGLGGMLGVLVGGALITGLGYEALYGAASLLAALAAACAWRMQRLERAQHDEHQPVV
ncbi:MAG: hypothetical protein RI884_2625 [Pseudomonadota bacterium]